MTPKGFESNLPQNAKSVLSDIQKTCSESYERGLIAASRSWHSDMKKKPIDGVVCDLVLISPNMEGLHLVTLCSGSEFEPFLQCSREAAESIKRRLVQEGACREKFFISYHVVSCEGTTKPALTYNWYPPGYELDRKKLNEVLKALVILLATVPSPLGSKMGVSIMNLLTEEQFQLVYQQIEVNKELWVHGAAGTGKTLVAIEFMRELHHREKLRKHEILCVCENQGIAQQIRYVISHSLVDFGHGCYLIIECFVTCTS